MKKILVLLFVFLFLFLNHKVQAQQDAQFSLYMFNKLYFNPAYAGLEGVPVATIIYRDQWTGYETSFDGAGGAPKTLMASFDMPFPKFKSGLGFQIVNDRLGAQNNTEFQANYAYHLQFQQLGVLSLGVRLGTFLKTIDRSKYRWIDDGDPLIEGENISQFKPDVSAGFYFSTKQWNAGIGITHLLQSDLDLGNTTIKNVLSSHMNVQGAYNFILSENIVLSPSILFKTDFKNYSSEYSAFITYRKTALGGVAFRQLDALTFIFGYAFRDFRLNYSMDYVLSGQNAKSTTSHEIQLIYRLPLFGTGLKNPIHTPRYIL